MLLFTRTRHCYPHINNFFYNIIPTIHNTFVRTRTYLPTHTTCVHKLLYFSVYILHAGYCVLYIVWPNNARGGEIEEGCGQQDTAKAGDVQYYARYRVGNNLSNYLLLSRKCFTLFCPRLIAVKRKVDEFDKTFRKFFTIKKMFTQINIPILENISLMKYFFFI